MLYQDKETNKLFLSQKLQKWYPDFYQRLSKLLDSYNIKVELLKHTKDIWVRDFMPLQRKDGKFVRYEFLPDYLDKLPRYKTDTKKATSFLPNDLILDMPINIDGGNIIKSSKAIICTDKVLDANKNLSKDEIINILKNYLEVEDVYIVPKQPEEMTGHIDGIVRFIDDKRVIINAFSSYEKEYENKLIKSLKSYGFKIEQLPVDKIFFNNYDWSPYINFLQIGNNIIIPGLKYKKSNKFLTRTELDIMIFFYTYFPDAKIDIIEANEIINDGGALNCCSWSVCQDLKKI